MTIKTLKMYFTDTGLACYLAGYKKSKNPSKNMIKNFNILKKGEKEIGEGGVICMVDKIYPLDEKNNAIPIQCI